jgi:hypothetical protein
MVARKQKERERETQRQAEKGKKGPGQDIAPKFLVPVPYFLQLGPSITFQKCHQIVHPLIRSELHDPITGQWLDPTTGDQVFNICVFLGDASYLNHNGFHYMKEWGRHKRLDHNTNLEGFSFKWLKFLPLLK